MVESEKLLAILYLLSGIFGSISSICMGIVWAYWAGAVDRCSNFQRDQHGSIITRIGDSCGCILYATSTFSGFVGSDSYVCRFITFAPLPAVLVASVLAGYHGYRSCIKVPTNRPAEPARKSVIVIGRDGTRENKIVYGMSREPSSCFSAFAVNSCLFSILLFVTAIVLTDGYYHSCNQYKQAVIKTILATGNVARMIGDRLSCSATYDFLDYIQPDTSIASNADYYYGATGLMHTAFLLNTVLISSWIHFNIWIMISVINILSARKMKQSSIEAMQLQPLCTDL